MGMMFILIYAIKVKKTVKKEPSFFESPRHSPKASSRTNSASIQSKPCSIATEYIDHNQLGDIVPHEFEKARRVELKVNDLYETSI